MKKKKKKLNHLHDCYIEIDRHREKERLLYFVAGSVENKELMSIRVNSLGIYT
jgi:hypothetical protein